MKPRPLLLVLLPLLVAATPREPDEAVRARMRTHWKLAAGIQTEVIRGHLDLAAQLAGRLADLPVTALPSDMRGPLTELRIRSRSVVIASDIEEAAAATARLGATCAGCHERFSDGPSTHPRSIPSEDWTEDLGMTRHQWAADWLWLGLLVPSQDAWDRGARELSDAPILDVARPDVPNATAMEAQVHDLAGRAVGLTDPHEKTELLGELLAACARCHVATSARP